MDTKKLRGKVKDTSKKLDTMKELDVKFGTFTKKIAGFLKDKDSLQTLVKLKQHNIKNEVKNLSNEKKLLETKLKKAIDKKAGKK